MTHDLLCAVLNAQEVNGRLGGQDLRAAAGSLLDVLCSQQQAYGNPTVLVWPVDSAGERIVGAASMLDSGSIHVVDHTRSFPSETVCLLVSGVVAGEVSLADAAAQARAAGADSVGAAVLEGWSGEIPGIDSIAALRMSRSRVA